MTIIVANPEPLGAPIRITALLYISGSAMTHIRTSVIAIA